jgi:hypothetical protein
MPTRYRTQGFVSGEHMNVCESREIKREKTKSEKKSSIICSKCNVKKKQKKQKKNWLDQKNVIQDLCTQIITKIERRNDMKKIGP